MPALQTLRIAIRRAALLAENCRPCIIHVVLLLHLELPPSRMETPNMRLRARALSATSQDLSRRKCEDFNPPDDLVCCQHT
jgi:hypothetical protein